MNGHAARSWLLALRIRVAAALCVIILLAAVHPAHAARQVIQAAPGPLAVVVMPTGDEAPIYAEAVMDHSACQCGCETSTLPAYPVRSVSMAMSFVEFGTSLAAGSHPAAHAPPSEPPRT